MIKKTRQTTMWTEAGILPTIFTTNRYKVLIPTNVYVSNDVTIPVNSNLGIGAETYLYFVCSWATPWMFDTNISRVIRYQ